MRGARTFFRLACAFAAWFTLHESAFAQQEAAWPSHPLHIVVPLPAGSAADVVARLIGAKISDALGQPVIIDNRDGGSGVIGTTQVARAKPDGYTLGLATTTTLVTAPALDSSIGYEPAKDFAPVAMLGFSPYVFVVNPMVPARTIPDFIALAKSKPGVLTYSSVGEGSLARLGAELLSSMAGVRLTHVPYKSSTQAIVDLVAGRIDSQFGILATTHQYIREGKLNALGVTTLERVPEFRDMPTIAESGLPGFEATLWLALVAPAGVDQRAIDRLNAVINKALAEPETNNALHNQAIIVDTGSPEKLRQRILADARKWSALAAQAGLAK